MKLTGWSPKRTVNDDYQVNANCRWLPAARNVVQNMGKHCTNAQVSTGLHERDKYNHCGEDYVLDVDEWDAPTHEAIDIYNQWLLIVMNDAGSGSSHLRQVMSGRCSTLMVPTNNHAEIWTTPSYQPRRHMNHECSTGWHIEYRISLEVEISRNWGARLPSGEAGSSEFQNSRPEEKWSIECSLLQFSLYFSSHLHTSLFHWILARYK